MGDSSDTNTECKNKDLPALFVDSGLILTDSVDCRCGDDQVFVIQGCCFCRGSTGVAFLEENTEDNAGNTCKMWMSCEWTKKTIVLLSGLLFMSLLWNLFMIWGVITSFCPCKSLSN